MILRQLACSAMISLSPLLAEPESWEAMLLKLNANKQALIDEEKNIGERIRVLDEQSKVQEEHMNLLRQRLGGLNEKLEDPPSEPDGAQPDSEAEAGETPSQSDAGRRESELSAESADCMVVLKGAKGLTSIAFFAPHDGKVRIFASAEWIAENRTFSVTGLDGKSIPISQEISIPVGSNLLGLQPENENFPHLELATNSNGTLAGTPFKVGARILVLALDGKSKELAGVGGTVRGIGPDTFELDADLTSEMNGAPVLALDSGKVIGIVAPQVAGVTSNWALGTRHESIRNFALRLDRIEEWQTSDLGRFTKEAAYVDKIKRRTLLAWTAHTLIDYELGLRRLFPPQPSSSIGPVGETPEERAERHAKLKEEDKRRAELWQKERDAIVRQKEAALECAGKHPSDPQIKKALGWIAEFKESMHHGRGSEIDAKRAEIYRLIHSDLKKEEPDLSAHLSPYHKLRYKEEMSNRKHGIDIIESRTGGIGQ